MERPDEAKEVVEQAPEAAAAANSQKLDMLPAGNGTPFAIHADGVRKNHGQPPGASAPPQEAGSGRREAGPHSLSPAPAVRLRIGESTGTKAAKRRYPLNRIL